MSVDKFGHHSAAAAAKGKPLRGPKGDGFVLTAEGHYDILGKRMVNFGDPVDASDAVTKTYVDAGRPMKQVTCYEFNKNRLHDVGQPIEDTDAVTLQYMKEHTPSVHVEGKWDFHNKRISCVTRPLEQDDAVTKVYLEEYTPTNDGCAWSFRSKRLHMINDPAELSDAVNVHYLITKLGLLAHTLCSRLTTNVNSTVFAMRKEDWIRTNVSEPLFGDELARSRATKDWDKVESDQSSTRCVHSNTQ